MSDIVTGNPMVVKMIVGFNRYVTQDLQLISGIFIYLRLHTGFSF